MKLKIILILIVVAILGGAFYWFQWRPSQIRRECYQKADRVRNLMLDAKTTSGEQIVYTFNSTYNDCLMEYGLEK